MVMRHNGMGIYINTSGLTSARGSTSGLWGSGGSRLRWVPSSSWMARTRPGSCRAHRPMMSRAGLQVPGCGRSMLGAGRELGGHCWNLLSDVPVQPVLPVSTPSSQGPPLCHRQRQKDLTAPAETTR
ncbi:hypothetical protein GDO81_024656 [Engystomops pustulosus]|uniref:Uncharacterized protein n=1 Tax=Engystomops pustulosus TaxID=76066 RepID=A0AAV6YMQ1_ENGPU|nr:hypothetical protein GDO81_024656 [Engystomops pustulosus]